MPVIAEEKSRSSQRNANMGMSAVELMPNLLTGLRMMHLFAQRSGPRLQNDMKRRDPAHQVLVAHMGVADVLHHGFEGFLVRVHFD